MAITWQPDGDLMTTTGDQLFIELIANLLLICDLAVLHNGPEYAHEERASRSIAEAR